MFVGVDDDGKSDVDELTGKGICDEYRTNPIFKHLKPYTDIIYDSDIYPLIRCILCDVCATSRWCALF